MALSFPLNVIGDIMEVSPGCGGARSLKATLPTRQVYPPGMGSAGDERTQGSPSRVSQP